MPLRLGFQISYRLAQPTPMVAMLDIHDSHADRVIARLAPRTSPQLPLHRYRDRFGNTCTRLLAPAGLLVLHGEALVDAAAGHERARPAPVVRADTPAPAQATTPFLQASRYCPLAPLLRDAHLRFGDLPSDRLRVQTVCAHVARILEYAPDHADCSRTALAVLQEGTGACRDFAHVAIALCRCLGIPARYCSGYPEVVSDATARAAGFSAWFEAWIDGRWQAFDPRLGGACPARVPVARGRDAADTATSCGFGPCEPEQVEVWASAGIRPARVDEGPAHAHPLALAC